METLKINLFPRNLTKHRVELSQTYADEKYTTETQDVCSLIDRHVLVILEI